MTDEGDAPVPECMVELFGLDDESQLDWGKTDATGAVRFSGLSPDVSVRLWIKPPPDRKDLLEEVKPWRPTDTHVRLCRNRSTLVSIVDESGRPRAGFINQQRYSDAPDAWRGDGTDQTGSVLVDRIHAGEKVRVSYTSDVSPFEFARPTQWYVIDGDTPRFTIVEAPRD